MSRSEKKQARIERYEELARKAEQGSMAAYERSNDAVRHIVPGQPILVGHHSERKHRNALDRSWNAMGKSVELSKKAEYYRDKAKAAENNNAIYTEDEDAVKQLEAKIEKLTALQVHMKDCNKIFKSKKLTDNEKIAQLVEKGLSESEIREKLAGDFCGRIGYADFELTNNNAVIRNAKQRLEQVKKLKEMAYKEYEINGIKVAENPEENRFQIFFGYKPSEEVRKKLKAVGFRWSPSNECWQCYFKSWNIRYGKEILNKL